REPPYRHPSPALSGREEAPVGHRLAELGVGDVVGGEPEGLDGEQRLPRPGRGRRGVLEAALVQVGPRDQEVHRSRTLCAGTVARASMRRGARVDATPKSGIRAYDVCLRMVCRPAIWMRACSI